MENESNITRHKVAKLLEPLAFDGTECWGAIDSALHPARRLPSFPQLGRDLRKLVARVYSGAVPVDAAVETIAQALENGDLP
jgi:hypothetical protein